MAVAIVSLAASFSSFHVAQIQNPAKFLVKSFPGSPLRSQNLQAHKKLNELRFNGVPVIRMTAATAPAPAPAPSDSENLDLPKYVKSRLPGGFAAQRLIGTGRRKTAVARVVLLEGSGKVIINGRTAQEYLQGNPLWLQYLKYPLATLGYETKYDVFVKAEGGGLSGQAQATLLGIARALCKANPDNRDPLKKQGLLTRDPRKVERKKVGLHKARKAPQFSKR